MKQANLGLNADELIARQAWLQDQARGLIGDRKLMEILAIAGTPTIVGSFRMGLMVWPDLDFTVATQGAPDLDVALSLIPRLVKESGAWRVVIADHRTGEQQHLPAGIYLGPDIVRDEMAWQIDIWLMDEAIAPERLAFPDRIMAQLTDAQRRAILAIKQVAAASDVYHRGVSSTDIYSAVLEHGVETPEEFAAWLASSGRSL